VDELGKGVGDVADGEEFELEGGEVGFELEELAGFWVVEGLVEVFGGAVEFFLEVVEVGEAGFEVLEEMVGVDAEVLGFGEFEVGLHGCSFWFGYFFATESQSHRGTHRDHEDDERDGTEGMKSMEKREWSSIRGRGGGVVRTAALVGSC
jgi:hypothetical protein